MLHPHPLAIRADLDAAVRAVASLPSHAVVVIVLNAAKGGSEQACELALRAHYHRLASDRGLVEIPVPATLHGDGARAWRSAAWKARAAEGDLRTLDRQEPELLKLALGDAESARQERETLLSTREAARSAHEEHSRRRDLHRRDQGWLSEVDLARRAILWRRRATTVCEFISSTSAMIVFSGVATLPFALVGPTPWLTAIGTGVVLGGCVTVVFPALLKKTMEGRSVGARTAVLGSVAVVTAILIFVGGLGVMRSLGPMGGATASGVLGQAGSLALGTVLTLALLGLIFYAATLDREDEHLSARAEKLRADETTFARNITQSDERVRECTELLVPKDEIIRRPAVLRAAFGQAATMAARIEEECAADAEEGLARAMDAYRHLMALSPPDREVVHNTVIRMGPEVFDA